ncbi:MAG: hypothetical protein OXL41_02450 [Nitrospinae bacterium]|nr:hypothetical protein [Nitrospinota bacterium]
MIFVAQQPEPDDFDENVRQPGQQFLFANPNPTSKEFAAHAYWREAAGALRSAYGEICAYTCHWISPDTGWQTVEHFVPKSVDPQRAYDWSNYRLVCGRLNGRKGDHQDILDPFVIAGVMFVLDFPSMLVKPRQDLPQPDKEAVLQTISRLKLNDDDTCVAARLNYVVDYCEGDISLDFLRRHAPFIFRELERQELRDRLRQVMGMAS